MPVNELLLGDNAFIGVSHLSQERARRESREATLENIAEVIEASVDSGATGFTFSIHPKNLELITHLYDSRKNLLGRLNYYALTPYVHAYLKKAGEKGTPALVRTAVLAALQERSSIAEMASAALSLDVARFVGVLLESEVSPFLKMIPRMLASGVLAFQEALAYISGFGNSLYGVVTATTRPERARENFRLLAANLAS